MKGRERSGQREVFMSPVSVFVRLPGRAAGFVHFQNFFRCMAESGGKLSNTLIHFGISSVNSPYFLII